MSGTPWALRGAFGLVLAGLLAVALAGGGGDDETFGGTSPEAALAAARADPVPYDGRSPAPLDGERERVAGLGLPVHVPPPALCTDNAAMIASAARFVEPVPFPGYLAMEAYATGEHAL